MDRHHTLDGNKLIKVINSKQPTKLNLHIGPAHIGVIRNIITMIIFNLLSIILSQLLLPETYCPTENLVSIFINLFELTQYYPFQLLYLMLFAVSLSKAK